METEILNQTHKTLAPPQVFGINNKKNQEQVFPALQKVKAQEVISGFRKELIEFLIRVKIAKIVFSHFSNPLQVLKILKNLDTNRRKFLGESRIKKVVKVDHKYYWDLYIPGFGSATFSKFFEAEINRISSLKIKTNRFTNIFFAITKKCPLQCEHCFEWETLNKKEKLTLPDLKSIINKFQETGTGQFQLTGGEPLLRVNDIIEILKTSGKDIDFWILTSGFNLTFGNAKRLKVAGLTGVFISLDHFEPGKHNTFRGVKNSFQWVEHAVNNAIAANLVVTLSICVTKEFTTNANLYAYAELAKKMGVSFIQILEPKAVGHYKNQDVSLSKEQEKILDDFYLEMNYGNNYKNYPVISYHGYYQRKIGCFASGNRSLYIDTDGDLHACPFCQTKMGSALADDTNTLFEKLQEKGCHGFKSVNW